MDTDSDSDELFNKYIEVDYTDEKENIHKQIISVPVRQPNTLPEQFNKIVQFHQEHNEELLEKAVFDELWNKLSIELNDMGPPKHTVLQWKKKWSDHKYNRYKRKRPTDDHDKPVKAAFLDQPSHLQQIFEKLGQITEKLDKLGEVTEKLDKQGEVTKKLDEVCEVKEKLNVVIQNQNLILQILKSPGKDS